MPAGTRFLADGTAAARSCHWAPVTKNQPGVVPSAQPPHELPAGLESLWRPLHPRSSALCQRAAPLSSLVGIALLGVHLGAIAEVEADRLHDPEGGAGGEHVSRRQPPSRGVSQLSVPARSSGSPCRGVPGTRIDSRWQASWPLPAGDRIREFLSRDPSVKLGDQGRAEQGHGWDSQQIAGAQLLGRQPEREVAEADGNRTRLSRVAAHTGFEV